MRVVVGAAVFAVSTIPVKHARQPPKDTIQFLCVRDADDRWNV